MALLVSISLSGARIRHHMNVELVRTHSRLAIVHVHTHLLTFPSFARVLSPSLSVVPCEYALFSLIFTLGKRKAASTTDRSIKFALLTFHISLILYLLLREPKPSAQCAAR